MGAFLIAVVSDNRVHLGHLSVTHQPIQCSKRPRRDCWVVLFWTSALQIVLKELRKGQTHPSPNSLLQSAQVEFVKAEFQTKEEYILRKYTEWFHDISCSCAFQKLRLILHCSETLQFQIYPVFMRDSHRRFKSAGIIAGYNRRMYLSHHFLFVTDSSQQDWTFPKTLRKYVFANSRTGDFRNSHDNQMTCFAWHKHYAKKMYNCIPSNSCTP